MFDGKRYYRFSLVIGNVEKDFYCDNQKDFLRWVENIKKVTGHDDINENYEIKQTLGQGRFGSVKLCQNKITKREAAIKILSKNEMTERDIEQTRIEIEILKICHHPNIISLYDIFENQDYYYISKILSNLSNGALQRI